MASGDFCGMCGASVLAIDQSCPGCGADLASTAARRLIGTFLLLDYEVLEVLGQGGMAVVYRGRHRVTGQEVALKVLPPDMATRRDVRSRFVEEARALAQLDHPNIVHLYNFDSDNGSFVLAMQLADGPTWERLILEDGLSWRRSVELGKSVCSALEYAHTRGIVHRDMKPSNVSTRSSDSTPLVMDFGIAKGASDSRLTATGQTMGTVRYMSPEQVRGQQVDKRSDIYSLAVTLYESIAGETPFQGETHFEIMSAQLSSIATPLIEKVPTIPQALSDAVSWGMRKSVDNRPQSANEFGDALAQILAGQTPAIPQPSAVSSKSLAGSNAEPPTAARRAPVFIAVVAVLALAVVGAGVLLSTRDAETSETRATVRTPEIPPLPAVGRLPEGITFRPETTSKHDLHLVVADTLSAEPYVVEYDAGVHRWRAYLRSRKLQSNPVFTRPMPEARIIVAPVEALCDPAQMGSQTRRECLAVGFVDLPSRTLRIPSPVKRLPFAIDSFIANVYCANSNAACLDIATAYLNEIFLK